MWCREGDFGHFLSVQDGKDGRDDQDGAVFSCGKHLFVVGGGLRPTVGTERGMSFVRDCSLRLVAVSKPPYPIYDQFPNW